MTDIVDELLTADDPSIRWRCRVDACGEPTDSRACAALQQEIAISPRVTALLRRRGPDGRIVTRRGVYAKWQGAHWVLAALADIGYPAGDPSLRPLADQVLDTWLSDHYFHDFEAKTTAHARRGPGIPVMDGRHRRCASQQAVALHSLITLGLADERAHSLAGRLLHWQWPDGGWNCDKHPAAATSSLVETVHPVRALHLYAVRNANAPALAAARRAAEVLLTRELFRRRSTGEVIRADFVDLHYPPYWHYDILLALKVMAETGQIDDPRCRSALDLLETKRLPGGGWPAEARYYRASTVEATGNDDVDWGGASQRRANPWVTTDALQVLRLAGRWGAGG